MFLVENNGSKFFIKFNKLIQLKLLYDYSLIKVIITKITPFPHSLYDLFPNLKKPPILINFLHSLRLIFFARPELNTIIHTQSVIRIRRYGVYLLFCLVKWGV